MNKKGKGGPGLKNAGKTLRRLMNYVGTGYKVRFILVLVCIFLSAIAGVAGSLFLGTLIDDYITPLIGSAAPNFAPLLRALVTMGCVYLVGILCSYAYNRNMVVVSLGVQINVCY